MDNNEQRFSIIRRWQTNGIGKDEKDDEKNIENVEVRSGGNMLRAQLDDEKYGSTFDESYVRARFICS